jgi:hypothetical protein
VSGLWEGEVTVKHIEHFIFGCDRCGKEKKEYTDDNLPDTWSKITLDLPGDIGSDWSVLERSSTILVCYECTISILDTIFKG